MQCRCVFRSLRGWCEDVVHYYHETREKLLEECMQAVRESLQYPDRLTVCKLGAGGYQTNFDVVILSALMKGMRTNE